MQGRQFQPVKSFLERKIEADNEVKNDNKSIEQIREQFYTNYAQLFLLDIPRLRYEDQTLAKYEEREKNYGKALLEAYFFGAKQKLITLELTHELVKGIHQHAIQHLDPEIKKGHYKKIENDFSISSNDLKLICNPSATIAGFWELVDRWIVNDKKSIHHIHIMPKKKDEIEYVIFRIDQNNRQPLLYKKINGENIGKPEPLNKDTHGKVIANSLADLKSYTIKIHSGTDELVEKALYKDIESAVTEKMQDIFNGYNQKIRVAKSDDEKIKIIAQHVAAIEQLHPFDDGNARSCDVLMNILLDQQGLLFSLRLDPNRLDCFSTEELVQLIKQGQEDFISFMHGQLPEFIDSYVPHRDFYTPPQLIPNAKKEVEEFISILMRNYHSAYLKRPIHRPSSEFFTTSDLKNIVQLSKLAHSTYNSTLQKRRN